jgi:hypothetical protein
MVLDAQTGAGIAAGATLILHSSACSDSVVGISNSQVLSGCNDREGTYDVTVRKAGYREWTKSNVVVRDTCSLETARFDVRLERFSNGPAANRASWRALSSDRRS